MKATAHLSSDLSPDVRVWQALANAGQALLDAASAALGKGLAPVASLSARSPGVAEMVTEFLNAKARKDCSDRYLRQLHVSLSNFARGRSRRPLSEVTTAEIEQWMLSQDWAPKTCKTYVGDVSTLFNFAINRGYLDRNPCRGVELPAADRSAPIGIHTPAEVRQVLDTARRADLDVCRHLAIRYFAGVREAEVHRLRETDLKIEQGFIEVPASKSKTRSRRLVTIQPNLRAWLELGGELRAIGRMNVRRVIRLSKVKWKNNAPRHSFVSYHLAQFQNAGKTALEAGNSEQMVFSNYRAVVAPAAAVEFWGIVP